jgi:hypothetical protein
MRKMTLVSLVLVVLAGMMLGVSGVAWASGDGQSDGELSQQCVERQLVSMLGYRDGLPIEVDEFEPGDTVVVVGYGFKPCRGYDLYIQPYSEGAHVAEGDILDPSLDPSGAAPRHVTSSAAGTIGPVELWQIPAEGYQNTYWEIVADDVGKDCGGAGIYDSASDGLDAVALGEEGFRIVPEAATIVLFSIALAGLGGVFVIKRRRHAGC